MATRSNESIAQWTDGDSVTGFALLTKKETRQDRHGNTFLDLELRDATGVIAGKVWSDSPALSGDYERFDFVAVKGNVRDYRGQLQLNVQACRRAEEDDRAHGFDESRLIPSTREDIGELYKRLRALYEQEIQHPHLRRLALETLAVHGPALREHPAAKTIHHAYRGGLLEHTLSMAELADAVCAHYPDANRELVLLGVLFHDLGKLDELGAMPANDYTDVGRLVGHVVLGRDLLRERCAAIEDFPGDLQLQLEHLVLSHQGRLEYGAAVQPSTLEAVVLHFVDDLDSKINQLRQAREAGGGFQYLRGFGRYLFVGDSDPEGDAAGDAEEGAENRPKQAFLEL